MFRLPQKGREQREQGNRSATVDDKQRLDRWSMPGIRLPREQAENLLLPFCYRTA
jgi:hypothetical protein